MICGLFQDLFIYQLIKKSLIDFDLWIKNKKKLINNKNIYFVAPSNWIKHKILDSS